MISKEETLQNINPGKQDYYHEVLYIPPAFHNCGRRW